MSKTDTGGKSKGLDLDTSLDDHIQREREENRIQRAELMKKKDEEKKNNFTTQRLQLSKQTVQELLRKHGYDYTKYDMYYIEAVLKKRK